MISILTLRHNSEWVTICVDHIRHSSIHCLSLTRSVAFFLIVFLTWKKEGNVLSADFTYFSVDTSLKRGEANGQIAESFLTFISILGISSKIVHPFDSGLCWTRMTCIIF